MVTWLIARYFWFLLISVWRVRSGIVEEPLEVTPWDTAVLFFSEGDSLNVKCNVNGSSSAIKFRWFRDGKPLLYYDALLQIDKLSPNESGEYRCSVSNEIGTVLSPPLKINVLYIYGFVEKSKRTLQVPLNHAFVIEAPKLNASKEITDFLTWRWFREDEEIHSDRDFYIAMSGDLVILKPSYGVGTYRAEASYRGSRFDSPPQIVSNDYSVASEPAFGILYQPKSKETIRGLKKSAVFECVPNQFEHSVAITWFIDDQDAASFNCEFSDLNRRLIIQSPERKFGETDKVKISCLVTQRPTASNVATAYLDLYEKPSIARSNIVKTVLHEVGNSVEITCNVSGKPTPAIHWLHNGHNISNGSTLRLASVKAVDSGFYQCEATNAAGALMRNFLVKSLGASLTNSNDNHGRAPKISNYSANITVSVGESVNLFCKADPSSSMTWTFDGTLLNSDNKYQVDGESFRIISFVPDDVGVYTCHATNQFGSDEASIVVQTDDLNFIENGPKNFSTLIGSDIEIPCKVKDEFLHRGSVLVNWSWQGYPISPNGNVNHRLRIKQNGALEIKQVGPDNIGVYTCSVRVGLKEQTMSAWLKVFEKPSMPLAVKAELLNETVRANILVSWKEGFNGNSPLIKHIVQIRSLGPTGVWSDWEVVNENVPIELCCFARIDNLKPSSTVAFRVIAVNRYGAGKPSLPSNNVTTPQQPPAAAPRNVAASARSSTSIMVQWQPPLPEQWNGDILGYIIRYRLANYATLVWNEKNVSDGSKRDTLLERLITWREYEVQIAAYNHRGMGVFSKPLYVTTLEDVPTQAPKNLTVSVLNSTAIAVSFTSPDPQMVPGLNQGYKIDLFKGPVASSHLFRQVRVPPDDIDIFEVITDLEKFGHYNVTVLCYTTPGDGPRSEPVEVTTMEDLPSAVESFRLDNVLSSSVDLLWEAPAEPNGFVQKYVVSYWEDGNSDKSQMHEVDPNIYNTTIDGLNPSTRYTVEIQAFTSIGGGPKVEAKFESGVPPELPGRPSSLSVSEVGSRSVLLRFLPGFDGHTFINKWIVEGKTSSSSAFYPIFETKAPKARSILVQKLKPFTKYQLRLIAENVRGRSLPSDATEEFTTLQSEPEVAPDILFAEPVSATSISIVWTPLRSMQWNGHPKGYLLLYRAQSSNQSSVWKEIRVANSKTGEFALTDLHPYTLYEIELLAENSVGKSKQSGKAEVKTYEDVPSAAPADVELVTQAPKTAIVFWRPVEASSANGIIIGYKVRLIPEEERYRAEFSRFAEVDAFVLKTTFSHLRPFTQYRAFVSAFTIVGSGPENSSASLQSEEDVPGEPYIVAFSYVNETEVRLKWNPPLNPNGVILNYEITYWKHGAQKEATKVKLPFNIYGFSCTGLQRHSHYKFAVSAETSVGWGPQAVVSVLTTSESAPSPPPPIPDRNEAKPQSPTEIFLKWNNTPTFTDDSELNLIRSTDVEYRTYGSEWKQIPFPISGTRNEATLIGLKPNTEYQARIRFNNDFEHSVWSVESPWIKTLDGTPSAPPVLIQASPFESSSLLLQWRPPPKETWNSDVIKFRLSYRVYFSNESITTEEVEMSDGSASKIQYMVEKLKSFRHYVVQVQAVNELGASPYSSPMFAYVGYSIPKQKVKNLVADAISSTSILVKWELWDSQSGDVISGFKIRYVPVLPVLSSDSNLEEVFISENNSVILTELRKFTEYQVSVSTYNRAGEGEVTLVRAVTLEDRPGPVSGLSFSDILLDSVNVTWNTPAEPNGKILGYLINYKAYKLKDEFKKEMQEKTSLNYYVATGLEPNVTYFFSVRAETSVGYGNEVIGNVSIAPVPGCPGPPSKPRLLPGQTSVALEWQDSGSGDAPIKGHIIQAKRIARSKDAMESSLVERKYEQLEGSFLQSNRPQHVIGEWVTLSNAQGEQGHYEVNYRQLEASSFYVFRVFAHNFHGAGFGSPESDQLHVPASLPEDPFYTKWWFIVMVALVTFVVIVVVVAFLCVTGSRYKYAKRNSVDSLQLADGGIVSYELRASKRRNLPHLRRDIPARPNTNTSWISDSREPPAYGSIGDIAPPNNMYGSLATDVVSPERRTSALLKMGFARPCSVGGYGNNDPMLEGFSPDADSVDDPDDNEDQEPNIAQHYEHEDTYRQTWRRARAEALAEVAPNRHSRPASCESNQSEMVIITSPHSNHGSSVMNGFSSFV